MLGLAFTVTVVGVEVVKQPWLFVTRTVYAPDAAGVEIVMDCVVAPLLHSQLAPAEALKTTLPGSQKVSGPLAVIVATGIGLTVTVVAAALLTQPPLCVTATVNDPVELTVMDCVVAPLLHK